MKFQENENNIESGINNNSDDSQVPLTDYYSIDPPSSKTKASLLYPGPIEHGSPVNPYIPKPSPPDHPPKPGDKPGDSD